MDVLNQYIENIRLYFELLLGVQILACVLLGIIILLLFVLVIRK